VGKNFSYTKLKFAIMNAIRSFSRISTVFTGKKIPVQFQLKANHSSYESAYKESIENPTKFWAKAADNIRWFTVQYNNLISFDIRSALARYTPIQL
jgi:hypothetical protein